MGGHLAIQGDLAQLDLAVLPACGSRHLSGSTGPVPGIHPRLSAWNTLATASLDHSSPSRHQDRSCGGVKRCTDAQDSVTRSQESMVLMLARSRLLLGPALPHRKSVHPTRFATS